MVITSVWRRYASTRLSTMSRSACRQSAKILPTSKQRSKKTDSHAILKLVDDIHPAIILWLGQWLISSGHLDDLPTMVNTVVTNVPGLSTDAYLAGAKLIDYLGFGPLAPNVGLFHTVSSTADHVNVTFLSTAECLGDGSEYRACLERSWTEITQPVDTVQWQRSPSNLSVRGSQRQGRLDRRWQIALSLNLAQAAPLWWGLSLHGSGRSPRNQLCIDSAIGSAQP